MSKKIFHILSTLLLFSLVGCGAATSPEIIMPDTPMTSEVNNSSELPADNTSSSSSQQAVQDDQQTEKYKVYLITMDLADNYWKSIDEGCQKAVKELGNVDYKWIGPDSHSDSLQSVCIDEAVSNGANAILIAANSPSGVNASLQKAAESGCKIIYVDSSASFDCVTALATDNEAAGSKAAQTMVDELNKQGITSGTIGIFGVTPDTTSCVARETGFRKFMESSNFKLADTIYMNDDAANVTSGIASGLKENYVGFFTTNEGTTVAAGEALKDKSGQALVVGFDTSDAVLNLVNQGIIYATMQQNPSTMGYDGVKIAVQSLDGDYKDTNTKTDTGVTVITKDSL